MKRLLISILSVAMLALVAVAVASSAASFNPNNAVGFIGRGDVVSALGKDALHSGLTVLWSGQRSETWDCTFSDGSTQRTTVPFHGFWLAFAQKRLNPNGVVTGYETPGTLIDGGFFYPGEFPCSNVIPEGATLTGESRVACGDWAAHLYIATPSSPFTEIPFTTVNGC